MSTAIAQGMRFTVDINAGLIERPQREILMRGDKNANQIVITVMEGKAPANMTGATASGMFIRQSGLNVPITGTVSGNVITMTLNDHCYVESGRYEAFVRLKSANTMRTILLISGNVHKDGDGAVVDVEEVIPSIDDLLAKLEEMRTVTAAANAAATNANNKATTANTAATNANTARDAANAAATNANNKATAANTAATAANTARNAANAAAQTANTAAAKIDGMTVSATKLSPGANPTATISETGGHKHVAFGIPKGDKGETGNTGATGATPDITFTVKTGAPGTQVQISQGGTAENPTVELTIPRGDTGNIENLTVNGVAPNAAGNVPLDVVTNERYYNRYTAGGAGDADVLTDTFALVPISTTANPSLYAALGNVGSYAYVRTSFFISQSTTARRYQVAYNYNGSVQRKAFRTYGPSGWMPWQTDASLGDIDGVVRYNAAQSLTNTQKRQALDNIYAVPRDRRINGVTIGNDIVIQRLMRDIGGWSAQLGGNENNWTLSAKTAEDVLKSILYLNSETGRITFDYGYSDDGSTHNTARVYTDQYKPPYPVTSVNGKTGAVEVAALMRNGKMLVETVDTDTDFPYIGVYGKNGMNLIGIDNLGVARTRGKDLVLHLVYSDNNPPPSDLVTGIFAANTTVAVGATVPFAKSIAGARNVTFRTNFGLCSFMPGTDRRVLMNHAYWAADTPTSVRLYLLSVTTTNTTLTLNKIIQIRMEGSNLTVVNDTRSSLSIYAPADAYMIK